VLFRSAVPYRTHRLSGFTLIELLVVISIIALLIGILLPVLGSARASARDSVSLSNVRQIGSIAMTNFVMDHKGLYPWHSSDLPDADKPNGNKPRWADYVFPYIENTDVFVNPHLDLDESILAIKWWHETSSASAMKAGSDPYAGTWAATALAEPVDGWKEYGGYGYNYQYLGNARPLALFRRSDATIANPVNTLVVGDTLGANDGTKGQYAIDPPETSDRGSGKTSGYYGTGGSDEENRSTPGARGHETGEFTFADGHAEAMKPETLDDYDSDGTPDNGYYNGYGDPSEL
jgi:prepilin-type N-terminal cleavage/methylation domain-containing protein